MVREPSDADRYIDLIAHPRRARGFFYGYCGYTCMAICAIIVTGTFLNPWSKTIMAMSQEHKDALAKGRLEARAIKSYLKALDGRKPGRPVTKESLDKRLARVDSKLGEETDPLKKLDLMQSRLEIENALQSAGGGASIEELAAGFASHAKSYSDRKGISYTTWRQFGVPAELLRKAGIPETRRR